MDLWADIDNHHLLAVGDERSHISRSARRLTDAVVLSLVRSWLLQDYAASYCRALGTTRIFRRCYWIDALGLDAKSKAVDQTQPVAEAQVAPVARTRKERKNVDAQPVPLVLQPIVSLSQALAQESKPISLYGLVLDAGSSKRKEVRATPNSPSPTSTIALPKESGIVHGSWLEAAGTLLTAIEASPAIFLLNPLGLTLFSYEDLAPLYQRTVPTELCLLLPHKQITARLLAVQRAPAQSAALTALLRSDRWKSLDESQQAITGFIDLFTAAMERHFRLPVQRISLPIAIGPAHIEELPYTLIFATRRQDSLFCMNDAYYDYQQSVYRDSYRGVLNEEWFDAQLRTRQAEALRLLRERTSQQGRAQRIRRWPDLRQQMLLAHFGRFALRDYDAIIQQLLANGEVRCEWRLSGSDDVRLPGNEDTLDWR